jgi:hypothetical protein
VFAIHDSPPYFWDQWGWPPTEPLTVIHARAHWWTLDFANAFVSPGGISTRAVGSGIIEKSPKNITFNYKIINFANIYSTRNTCMQQPLAYIFQTLFLHEVFVITPTLNAGSRFTSCLSWQHDNCFLIFCTNWGKIDEIWTLLKYRTINF